MLFERLIPCLLWQNEGLIKTTKFKKAIYIGDATNAIRIFNDKEVDELILLDIDASKENRGPDLGLIERVASECFMPLCYGGGISTLEDIKRVLEKGVEKVSISSAAINNPEFIKEAAKVFGSSTIVVCIDYKKNLFGKNKVFTKRGAKKSNYNPIDFAKLMEEMGAGEILIQSIDRDGTMAGYDKNILKEITTQVTIPVIAMGGAKNINDLYNVIETTSVSAAAAGSTFVFQGKNKAVLINYPKR
tara:strand:+ start:438 stop:1175 length:738 start_codon:yes stop_codon:yes gene_type:complete